jgi:hypothetical protein
MTETRPEMKVCKKCKNARWLSGFNPDAKDDPRSYICSHPACIDPVVGVQITCIEARNLSMYCGKYGDFYAPKDEKEEVLDSEDTKIITGNS